MEITEEEFLTDDFGQEIDDLYKETWPLPAEDTVREFEQYLLDIGVRF